MWSGTNNSKLRRTVNGNTRPNYLKYGDVFMTSPLSQQRRPVNKVRSFRNADEEQRLQRNNFQTTPPRFMTERFPDIDRFSSSENITLQDESNFDQQPIDAELFDRSNQQNSVSDFYLNRRDFRYPQSEQLRPNISRRNIQQPEGITGTSHSVQSQGNIYFRKNQLPRLQRYDSGVADEGEIDNYWNDFDEYSPPKKKSKYRLSFPQLWQKFVITFTSLLSVICLTWIAYNWKTTGNDVSIPEIKSEKSVFKVLPDAPNGTEFAYQNKAVYDRVNPNIRSNNNNERLMSPPEEPGELPMSNNFNNLGIERNASVPSYRIIDDRDYYVKCRKNSDVIASRQQIVSIRKKLSMYSHPDVLLNVSCSIRKVANTQGQLGEYILIGPFEDEVTARNIGIYCQLNNGEIISVQKKEHQ